MISGGMFEYWQRNEFQKIKNLIKKSRNNTKSDSSSSFDDNPIKPLTNFQLQSAYYFFFHWNGCFNFVIFR